jgi:hypothetical protein
MHSDQLHNLDSNVLNPAIAQIIGIALGASSNAEGMLKPLINSLLKPLGLIKDKAETVTTQVQSKMAKKKSDPELTATAKRAVVS